MSHNRDLRRSMLSELLEGQRPSKKQKTSRTAPLSTLLLDGQRALESRCYQDAIQHFSNAIENIKDRRADLLYIYGLRMTAFTKIKDFNSALKDGKRMIRLDRLDHRGYIRCAQTELLRENPSGAVQVCQYGLKSLENGNGGRAEIQRILSRSKELSRDRIVFEKSTDPMIALPTELLEVILSYFDYKETLAIVRVSKLWQTRIVTSDILTRNVDTRLAHRKISLESIKAALSRSRNSTYHMYISRLTESAARHVSTELRQWIKWESLKCLHINDGKVSIQNIQFQRLDRLADIRLEMVVIPQGTIERIIGECPKLRSATFILPSPPILPKIDLRNVDNDRLQNLVILCAGTHDQTFFVSSLSFFHLDVSSCKCTLAHKLHDPFLLSLD